MPVTKTAKRALRGSKRKQTNNKKALSNLEVAIKSAKRTKSTKNVSRAISLTDRASKNKTIHKNKAARIKSQLAKLLTSKKS